METGIIWLHVELLILILNICRFAVGFAKVLLENVNKRFPECGTQVEERCVANLLDPHLKGVHLSPAGKLNSTKALVRTRWSHLEEVRVVEEQEVEGVTPRPPLSPTSKLLKDAGGLVEEENTGVGRLSVELHRFEALPRLSKEGDPLLWWKIHETSLPMLAKIVREIFAIPASSSKSERVFSIGTKVMTISALSSFIAYLLDRAATGVCIPNNSLYYQLYPKNKQAAGADPGRPSPWLRPG